MGSFRLQTSEMLLAASGVALLASLAVIVVTGSFAVWMVAKVFYGIGVILFLMNR